MTRVMRAILVFGLFSPYSSLLSSPRTLLLSPLAYGTPITTTHTLPLWRNPSPPFTRLLVTCLQPTAFSGPSLEGWVEQPQALPHLLPTHERLLHFYFIIYT